MEDRNISYPSFLSLVYKLSKNSTFDIKRKMIVSWMECKFCLTKRGTLYFLSSRVYNYKNEGKSLSEDEDTLFKEHWEKVATLRYSSNVGNQKKTLRHWYHSQKFFSGWIKKFGKRSEEGLPW